MKENNLIILYLVITKKQVYIPKMSSYIKFKRNKNIKDDWKDGLNVHALAEKYKISDKTIYKILKTEQA